LETSKIYFEQTTRKMIAVTGKNLPYQLFDGFLLAKICKEYYTKNIIPLVNLLSDKEIQCAIWLTWL